MYLNPHFESDGVCLEVKYSRNNLHLPKRMLFWVHPHHETEIFDLSICHLGQRLWVSAATGTTPTKLIKDTMVENQSFHGWTGVNWELNRRHIPSFWSYCSHPLILIPYWLPSIAFDIFVHAGMTYLSTVWFGVAGLSILPESHAVAPVRCLWFVSMEAVPKHVSCCRRL